MQDPLVAAALQKLKLVPCLPSTKIPIGDTPLYYMTNYENFVLRPENIIGKSFYHTSMI